MNESFFAESDIQISEIVGTLFSGKEKFEVYDVRAIFSQREGSKLLQYKLNAVGKEELKTDWLYREQIIKRDVAMGKPLYKTLRNIRLAKGELLKNMADKLGLGSAELSAIEYGRKPMPDDFPEKLKTHYPEYESIIIGLVEKRTGF